MPESLFLRRPDVLATPLPGDELALLHPDTQHYYTLNETGGFVWAALVEPISLDVLADRLTEAYDVTDADARASVREIVDLLCRESLATILPA